MENRRIYQGTFLIAFSTLALEITFTRLLSVVTWYHLSFFAVATALLGMTAGATTVYMKPEWFTAGRLTHSIARACLGYALIIPFVLVFLCITPIELGESVMSAVTLMTGTLACALPFYFAGIAISAVLTRQTYLPIGRLYASDLIGAAMGSLFVLGGLELFNAPSLILLCGAVGALAALVFALASADVRLSRQSVLAAGVISLVALLNSTTMNGIRPLIVKGSIERIQDLELEKWNSFSRVSVFKGVEAAPQYWGASPLAPQEARFHHMMVIDGDAGTAINQFETLADLEHLRFDVTNIAYALRPTGGALIIGVGGGRDVQSALLFGHEKVVGVEVNPIFIDLLQRDFRDLAGLADREDVTLVVDEGRSFASTSTDTYALIQMSLIDTWAATGAGAFSLSENALYTVEAWQTFFERLKDNGIFAVSRWHSPTDLGETGRAISLAVATLLRLGVENPAQHIAMVTAGHIATTMVSKQPFTEADIAALVESTRELEFELVIRPDAAPTHEVLRDIVRVRSLDELSAVIADKPLNYEPPTDENPYFFNMLRLNHLSPQFVGNTGVVGGNLFATITLLGLILCLLLLTVITIVYPLMVRARTEAGASRTLWAGALYFSMIGAGFMFVEIALIQRLSVFLSHPVYALGVLLFTIIASTGVGSLLSERLPLTRAPWIYVYPVVMTLAIVLMRFLLPPLLSSLITASIPLKIVVSIVVIFPMGILMGFFFPTGMRLARAANASDTPWYWALNGIFGVLCSAVAVFISIYFGVSTNFYLAAICYAVLLLALRRLLAAQASERRPDALNPAPAP